MKIKKTSWHYRVLRKRAEIKGYRFYKFPETLCSYFWTLVYSLLEFALMGLMLLTLSPLILPVVFVCFVGMKVEESEAFQNWSIERFRKNQDNPSLIKNFLKAKREKVCPLIEYEE